MSDADSPAAVARSGRVGPPTSVLVVGAGLAGSSTVTALRAQGFTGRVTLLGDEGLEPYDRPPLSKQLLTRDEPVWLRDDLGFDVTAADDVRLAVPALGLTVEPDRVAVTTTAGTLTADAVVLACGARAVRPDGWEAVSTLHTAADAEALRRALVPGSRLVVVGAGWIGAEVAGVAAAAGVRVTVVEAAPTPLAAAVGTAVGGLTVPWYDAAGVRLLTDATVVRVGAHEVELADGEVIGADVVLAAVGARADSAWLRDALPLQPDGSLLVDEHYRVLTPDRPLARVVAVGDLARRRSPRYGWVPGGHWDGALHGPAVAVRALLTGDAGDVPMAEPGPGTWPEPGPGPAAPVQDLTPYVFSTQLGHELGLYGQPGPADDVVLRGDPASTFTVLWFRPGSDELTAVLGVDRHRDVAAARKLFAHPGLPRLDRVRAADPEVPLRQA